MFAAAGPVASRSDAKPFALGNGAAFLAIFALSLLLRAWWFHNPVPEYDDQFYSLVGHDMLAGKLPYVDVWDRKPIGLFLIYAGAHAVLGAGPFAYLFVANLFVCADAWLVFRIAERLADRATALIAALLTIIGMGIYGCIGGQSELFFAAPALAMAWLLLTAPGSFRHLCLAMLLGGLAIQIKYSVAPFCALCGAMALWQRWAVHRRPARLVAEAAAFAVLGLGPTLAVAAIYAALGHWDAFVYANFISIFERPQMVGRFHAKTLAVIGPLVLATGTGIWAFFRSGRSYPARDYATVALFAAGSLASIYATGNVMAYYYAFFVPWAVLLAVPFIDLRDLSGRIGAILLVGAFLLVAQLPTRIADAAADVRAFDQMVRVVRSGGPQARLYVFSGPAALYEATGLDGGRFPFPSHHSSGFESSSIGVNQMQLVASRLALRPDFIVTEPTYPSLQVAPAAPMVMAEIKAHYTARARVMILGQPLVVWQRTR